MRLIGDARPTFLYDLPFVDEDQPQQLANFVIREVLGSGKEVDIFLTDRITSRRFGTYFPARNGNNACIYLYRHNWGVLAHELAHHETGGKHGWEFYHKHLKILDALESESSGQCVGPAE